MSLTGNPEQDALADLHARWHDNPGSMLYENDCGWERCEFWVTATFLREHCSTEREQS